MSRFAILRLLSGAFALNIRSYGLTADRDLYITGQPAIAGQVLRANNTDPTKLEWWTPPAPNNNTGTVTSVALSAPSDVFKVNGSPITSSGTLALAFLDKSPNLVLASPASGSASAPTFRKLVSEDLPNLDTSKITTGTLAITRLPVGQTPGTVAPGDDNRFHLQNTDTGTTSQSFQLQTGAGGVRIKNNNGVLEARNPADSAYADLVVNNLVVRGTTTTVDANTVNLGDNIITLNSDYVGSTPTENGGLSINRGTLKPASLIWNESKALWAYGLEGEESDGARVKVFTFTSTSLNNTTLAVTHNLNRQSVIWQVYDDGNRSVYPDAIATSSNVLTLDFGGITLSGTWSIVVTG